MTEEKSVFALAEEMTARCRKRRNYLQKKYHDQPMPTEVIQELKYIDQLEMNDNTTTISEKKSAVNLRTNGSDEWQYEKVRQWILSHPGALDGTIGKSTIYKFTMKFFAEFVVMNPKVGVLSYHQLCQLMTNANQKSSNTTPAMAKMSDEIEMILSMLQMLGTYIPETIVGGEVKYQEPIFKKEIAEFGAMQSTINPNHELAKVWQTYREKLGTDKQLRQKYEGNSHDI